MYIENRVPTHPGSRFFFDFFGGGKKKREVPKKKSKKPPKKIQKTKRLKKENPKSPSL